MKCDPVQRGPGRAVLREVRQEAGATRVARGARIGRGDRAYRDPIDRVDREHADGALQSSAALGGRPLPVPEGDRPAPADQPPPDTLGEEHAETLPAPSAPGGSRRQGSLTTKPGATALAWVRRACRGRAGTSGHKSRV